ncbi:DUF2703 domain-containing protein [Billgrantia sulfidoxydans]|uniref:DUF2703 domain-containing protein n=1 Tax=Billgrantia sulfidoxydans TaxID=2733484 RepID=A0ABX7W3L7_9GAMM|nr:DUF2703 domain-containing protein [Halomonas sulfidoxydans]QTP54760.1 DUF2703 domain-containing protein [Halomonas sulfidoxydans]
MKQKAQAPVSAEVSHTPSDIDIELLALDLTSCTRCAGTLENIEKAIEIVRPAAEAIGTRLNVNKIIIDSEARAVRHRFSSSPTVRVNGLDLAFETRESRCDSCTTLSGSDEGTSCRIWHYRGEEYTEAPVGLVVEALLGVLAGQRSAAPAPVEYGGVPENLRRFFAGRAARQNGAAHSCCDPSEQANCCQPQAKAECCGPTTEEDSCGCR